MADEMNSSAKWYVAHTYSGYENKVKANIEKTVENRNMHDQIMEVLVPVEDGEEERNGQSRTVQRKVFPGYVIIHMIMNDNTWYVVRNTRGVTGFVGPGSKPVSLSDEEVVALMGSHKEADPVFEVGDIVTIVDGPFKNQECRITAVDNEARLLQASMFMAGRDTTVEDLKFTQVEK